MNLAFFPTLSTSSLLSPTNVKNLEASSIVGHCAFQCCWAIGARVLLPFLVPMVDLYRLIDLRLFEIRYFPNSKSAPAAITVHYFRGRPSLRKVILLANFPPSCVVL
jgi:hypothetical protein